MKINNTRLSIRKIAKEVRELHDELSWDWPEDDRNVDIRLQVVDGTYYLHYGDLQYDTDHRGCWGYNSIFLDAPLTKKASREIAKELMDEASEMDCLTEEAIA